VIKEGSNYVSSRGVPMNLHVVSAEPGFGAAKSSALPRLAGMGRNVLPRLLLAWTSLVVSNAAKAKPNHLSRQAAPYLHRAIFQPVDWYPWGADAFKRARELNRPILLDMGAVWCGWCDLMDRESYNRAELAAQGVAVRL
jgi:thiol:disulfide interchange protein